VHGTPITVSPLSDLLGHDGVTDFGQKVLEGKEIPLDIPIPASAQALLKELHQVRPALPAEILFEEMI
jgi:hypothetical protein